MQNKPELKPFDKVLVRDNDDELWKINMFSSETLYGTDVWYQCISSIWGQCIPYKGNEHLLGTTDSPQKEEEQEEEKQDEVNDNYGYPVGYFKKNDIVLCRDAENEVWHITSFVAKGNEKYPFQCSLYRWKYCIPYEGNEHLHGTFDTPERYNPNKNTLFGVKLKPGYVLEFEYNIGILFPTANGFAVSYTRGCWQTLDGVEKDSIVKIYGIADGSLLRSGEVLWERPQKQTLTKAQIAEKLGIREQDFEIIEKENEENE